METKSRQQTRYRSLHAVKHERVVRIESVIVPILKVSESEGAMRHAWYLQILQAVECQNFRKCSVKQRTIPDKNSVEKITHWISNGSENGALKRYLEFTI